MSDLKTAKDVLEWGGGLSRSGCGCCADADHPEEIAEAARLAMRVLSIMERRAKTNDGSWINAEVRNVWPYILDEAEKGDKP